MRYGFCDWLEYWQIIKDLSETKAEPKWEYGIMIAQTVSQYILKMERSSYKWNHEDLYLKKKEDDEEEEEDRKNKGGKRC